MSYDIRIYTIEKQEFTGLRSLSNIEIDAEGFLYPLKNHQIVITKETPINDEDIPIQKARHPRFDR